MFLKYVHTVLRVRFFLTNKTMADLAFDDVTENSSCSGESGDNQDPIFRLAGDSTPMQIENSKPDDESDETDVRKLL